MVTFFGYIVMMGPHFFRAPGLSTVLALIMYFFIPLWSHNDWIIIVGGGGGGGGLNIIIKGALCIYNFGAPGGHDYVSIGPEGPFSGGPQI